MNYYQGQLFSKKPEKLRKHKDGVLPISIIVRIQNNTMKYYQGRWPKNKRVHIVLDLAVSGNFYSLCGIIKKNAPVLQDDKSEIKCTVCERIYKEICKRI